MVICVDFIWRSTMHMLCNSHPFRLFTDIILFNSHNLQCIMLGAIIIPIFQMRNWGQKG